jgi:hypothetical protein
VHERLVGAAEGLDRGVDDGVVHGRGRLVAGGGGVHAGVVLAQLRRQPGVVEQVALQRRGARSGDGLPGALAPDDGGDGVAVVDEAAQHGCTHEPGSPGEQDLHGVVNRDGPFGVPACPLRGRFSRGSP